MADIIDGELGPRTLRAVRNYIAVDAENKIVAACIASGHFDSTDEIHTLIKYIKAGAVDAALDKIEGKA